MKWNPWILPAVMIGGLGSVHFLPKVGAIAPSAARMELPDSNAGWFLEKRTATQDEIKTLGPETEFSKAACLRARPGEFNAEGMAVPDLIDLSVVLSGSDLNTSIHRPERCMPAQGHSITGSEKVRIRSKAGREFGATRLVSHRTLSGESTGGADRKLRCITYYFFIGHDAVTADHLERTLIDMKDRLLRGMDQRWAYVAASALYGEIPWIDKPVSEEEADGKLRGFLEEFADRQIDWSALGE
jgi:hypothetical protein